MTAVLPPNTAPATGRAAGRRNRLGLSLLHRRYLGIVSILSLVAGAAVVYALWNASTTHGGGIIVSGSLTAWPGTFEWQDVSADVPLDDRQSGTESEELAAYLATPGDTVEIRQGFTVKGEGENLQLELTFASAPEAASDGVSATYVIVDDAGQQIAPATGAAAIGSSVTAKVSGDREAVYTAVITWVYAPSAEPHLTADLDVASARTAAVGGFELTAQQVRGVLP
jgi:alternate signal-mediated exported protein